MRDRGERRTNKLRIGRVVALAAATIGLAAAPALASGAGAHTYSSWVGALSQAAGLYFQTFGPAPNVGNGIASMTHTRAYFNSADYYFVGVGFLTANTSSDHALVFQVSDQNGNYLYCISGYQYTPSDNVAAAIWHNSGNSWHFNWWDASANWNVGWDANNANGNGPGFDQASVGVDGWGGCPNGYPVNQQWDWNYLNPANGVWYTFPTTSLYNWGNTPSWDVWGDASSGGGIGEGTTSCP